MSDVVLMMRMYLSYVMYYAMGSTTLGIRTLELVGRVITPTFNSFLAVTEVLSLYM